MRKLKRQNLAAARSFLERDGREVDRSLLAFELGEGPPSRVIAAVVGYQNADGGFGRALEPDIRTEASSVINTTVAFQLLSRVGAPPDHPSVRRGIQYLVDSFDAERALWPIVPPEVEDADHAPWWSYAGTEEAFGGFRLNPTAEVLRYLLEYPGEVPAGLARNVTEAVLARISAAPAEIEMHDLMCCIRLVECRALPEEARAVIRGRVEAAADHGVERDSRKWSGYGTRPLMLVDRPSSFLAPLLRDEIPLNLDHEIAQQGDDGAWAPAWAWEGDAWPQAEKDWKSHLTARMVATLRAFGRVEGR